MMIKTMNQDPTMTLKPHIQKCETVGSGYFTLVSDGRKRDRQPTSKVYNGTKSELIHETISREYDMSSTKLYRQTKIVLNDNMGSLIIPVGVLAVAALMAATTTFGQYIAGYILFEVISLASQFIRNSCRPAGTVDDRLSTALPKMGLWKNILAALDDAGKDSVDEWLSTIYGTEVDNVKRENMEELVAGKSHPSIP